MASIKVAVRVRPFNTRELTMKAERIIEMKGKTTRIFSCKGTVQKTIDKNKHKDFTFDHSYWSFNSDDQHSTSQEQIFNDLGSDVIETTFAGYNACVFAYGQTGSGKTFTMMGTPESQGLIPRICEALFARMASAKETGISYATEISFVEIYNEKVRDLLRNDEKDSRHLKIRENREKGIYVEDLSSHPVCNYADIRKLMKKGNKLRTTSTTAMNDVSSRGHAIFTIKFVQTGASENGMPAERVSKLHLVDLAGSERVNTTGVTGGQLKECVHINKSLVTLGSVISALSDKSSPKNPKGSRGKTLFIPYRNSVLTWLLKDSLGGNSKTIMIAAISPADCNHTETLSTLHYAKRAKSIVNKPSVNENVHFKLIRELREEIVRLKSMIAKDITVEEPTEQKVLLAQIHEKQEQEKVLTEEWTEQWRQMQDILQQQKTLGLRKSGVGVVLDSEMPHLVGVDEDVLSTGITLYDLKEGRTLVGSKEASTIQDIVLKGPEVESEHCIINLEAGVVTLHPLSRNCWVNMVEVDKPTRLFQGSIILLGRNMFRYNDPAQAAQLRKEGASGNETVESTVANASRQSMLSVSDLHTSTSSDNLLNSNEELTAFNHLVRERAALDKEKEDFKREQKRCEEQLAAREQAVESSERNLGRERSIAAAQNMKDELDVNKQDLEQDQRDEMTQVENLCREVVSIGKNLQYKGQKYQEFLRGQHIAFALDRNYNQIDGSGISYTISLETWSSLANRESFNALRLIINHYEMELTTVETKFQTKVKCLHEHQARVKEMEEELIEIADKHREILNLEWESQKLTENKVRLQKRTHDQMQDILKRKQSLSLDLKRALPVSLGRSSSSIEGLSRSDLKSFQDAYNRKLRIASAICSLCQDAPTSTDTTETFHTAAAETPEMPEMPTNANFAYNEMSEDVLSESQSDTSQQKALESVKEVYSDCNDSHITEKTENPTRDDINGLGDIIDKGKENYDDNNTSASHGKGSKKSSMMTLSDNTMMDENKAMNKLNRRIAWQKMTVLKCFEANTPTRDDLNREILLLQDLQRQQIELEIWFMRRQNEYASKRRDSEISMIETRRHHIEVEDDSHGNAEVPETIAVNDSSQIYERDILSERSVVQRRTDHKLLAVTGYSSVSLTGVNQDDRRTSPYSWSITRSLPSLIPNDGSMEAAVKMIISVPCYIIRGGLTTHHYEYEVRIAVRDDSWTLLRRYRRFRELHISMKEKYGPKISAIRFPPRVMFPRHESVAKQRRKHLEEYLRRLIQVCSQLLTCEPLFKFRRNLNNINKQSLLEFNSFFRRGTFESTKYGTS